MTSISARFSFRLLHTHSGFFKVQDHGQGVFTPRPGWRTRVAGRERQRGDEGNLLIHSQLLRRRKMLTQKCHCRTPRAGLLSNEVCHQEVERIFKKVTNQEELQRVRSEVPLCTRWAEGMIRWIGSDPTDVSLCSFGSFCGSKTEPCWSFWSKCSALSKRETLNSFLPVDIKMTDSLGGGRNVSCFSSSSLLSLLVGFSSKRTFFWQKRKKIIVEGKKKNWMKNVSPYRWGFNWELPLAIFCIKVFIRRIFSITK